MAYEFKKTFEGNGDRFSAAHDAEQWLKTYGYSYGSTDIYAYRCVMRGDYSIAKWRNLTYKERAQCHGILTNNPTGSVVLKLHIPPDALTYIEAWDNGELSDGAWQAYLMEGVESYNETESASLDPHDTWLDYVAWKGVTS